MTIRKEDLDSHDDFVTLSTGVTLHIRRWQGQGTPYVLVHGLASNCRTWELVAEILADAGHRVITVDLRGHGWSEKPPVEQGYGFDTVTADLHELLAALALDRPVLAGQSWGGNVVLSFASRFPGQAQGYAFVDGGFLHLSRRGPWEKVAESLKPPKLAGAPYASLRARIRQSHPDWSEAAVDGTMGNFERLPDGTVRPWLTLDRHMAILRSLWEQNPTDLMPSVREPVLICPARSGGSDDAAIKEALIAEATTALQKVQVHWFDDTDHDIHQHRPQALAALFMSSFHRCP